MDYKDYLAQMQDDLNKKTRDILEQNQNRIDSLLNQSNSKKSDKDGYSFHCLDNDRFNISDFLSQRH